MGINSIYNLQYTIYNQQSLLIFISLIFPMRRTLRPALLQLLSFLGTPIHLAWPETSHKRPLLLLFDATDIIHGDTLSYWLQTACIDPSSRRDATRPYPTNAVLAVNTDANVTWPTFPVTCPAHWSGGLLLDSGCRAHVSRNGGTTSVAAVPGAPPTATARLMRYMASAVSLGNRKLRASGCTEPTVLWVSARDDVLLHLLAFCEVHQQLAEADVPAVPSDLWLQVTGADQQPGLLHVTSLYRALQRANSALADLPSLLAGLYAAGDTRLPGDLRDIRPGLVQPPRLLQQAPFLHYTPSPNEDEDEDPIHDALDALFHRGPATTWIRRAGPL